MWNILPNKFLFKTIFCLSNISLNGFQIDTYIYIYIYIYIYFSYIFLIKDSISVILHSIECNDDNSNNNNSFVLFCFVLLMIIYPQVIYNSSFEVSVDDIVS